MIDVRKSWKHKGRKCVILWVRDHFCAYVETKLKGVSYSQEFGNYETSPESNINAHGGITFSGSLTDLNDNIYYFGCDYAHYNDYIEGISEEGHRWTLEDVEKDTKKMCESIINYERVYKLYKKAFEDFEKKLDKLKQFAINTKSESEEGQ